MSDLFDYTMHRVTPRDTGCPIPGMCSRSPACHDTLCEGHPVNTFWITQEPQDMSNEPTYLFWAIVAFFACIVSPIAVVHLWLACADSAWCAAYFL